MEDFAAYRTYSKEELPCRLDCPTTCLELLGGSWLNVVDTSELGGVGNDGAVAGEQRRPWRCSKIGIGN
ncbi:MAG: hypothetical protein QW680_03855 [Pyrobaculum sp.]